MLHDERDPAPTGSDLSTEPDLDHQSDENASDPDAVVAPDDPSFSEYDKTIADSFPASDPPAQP